MRIHTLAQQQKKEDEKREAELYGTYQETAEDQMMHEKMHENMTGIRQATTVLA